jgi:Glucodextranase, domain B
MMAEKSSRMSRSRGLRAVTVAAAIGCAFVAAGCGSRDTKPTTTSSASSNGSVSITVTSPTSGSVVGAESVTVRGTVTPATAKVEINGHAAAVGNGAFAGVASLHSGQNTLNLIASASGEAPGTTTLVIIRQTNGSTGTTEAHHGETATATTKQRPSSTVTAPGGWPAATAAWTVVLASVGSRSEAEAQQERAHQAALPETGVLLSTQHSSLRPGYWVAFTGVLSHDEAVSRQQQARTSGFVDAYARFVSAE